METNMKTFVSATFLGLMLLLSGCSNGCDSAKADVIKHTNQYMNAIYQGQTGASVPGGAEAIAALEIAKKACNKPDLSIEEIVKPQN